MHAESIRQQGPRGEHTSRNKGWKDSEVKANSRVFMAVSPVPGSY